MDNKVIKTMAVAGLSATIITGCGTDGFDPSKEMQVDVYGPAPVMEREIEYTEPNVDDIDSDEFEPQREVITLHYGAIEYPWWQFWR